MKKSNIAAKLLAAGLVLGAASAANATPIIGSANLSFGLVSVSLGEIDFNPPLNPGLDATPTYGSFFTSSAANTGSFASAPFAGVTGGLVQDMSNTPADANYAPVGPQIPPISNYLQFAAQPGWLFSMNFLAPGDQGPYTLTQVGNNVSATISVNGFACDSGGDATCDVGDDVTQWTGIFSAQYTNWIIQDMIDFLLAGGTLENNTWSGTVEASAIPEPSTVALFGLGLLGLAGLRRRKQA